MQIQCIALMLANFDCSWSRHTMWETKYYHMQQYFDCTVVLKQDKPNFSMVTFWKAPACDRQKYNLRREVDVWRGCTRYGWWNSRDKQHQFVSCVCILKYLIKLLKAHARFISCFLISKPKRTRVEKGYEFFKFCIDNMPLIGLRRS